MPSVRLRKEPTVRQAEVILRRIEKSLGERGATVHRRKRDELSFRIVPWRALRPTLLLLVTTGRARVSAGRGEQRQIRYELGFAALHAAVAALSIVLVVVGWSWARLTLVNALLVLWGLVLLLRLAATRNFRTILGRSAREIVEKEEAEG